MKKFPTLNKLPSHKQFKFTPRYYDAVKEEVEMKMSRARKEQERSLDNGGVDEMKERIAGSFKRKRVESKRSFVIQFAIAIFLTLIFVYILKF